MKQKNPKKAVAAPTRNNSKPISDPRSYLPGHDLSGQRIAWRFGHVDDEGPWGLSRLRSAEVTALAQAMTSFESMTMNTLFGGHPGKDYDLTELPNKTARQRLEALQLTDMTQISRLRVTGPGRLYGFRIGNVFHVLWWDPNHEVWPSSRN